MLRVFQFWHILLIIIIVVYVSYTHSYEVRASELDSTVAQSIQEADLIVVGRVIGLIDSKPDAITRKHLEAHWIHVAQTLKGIDETGQKLAGRPNGLLWENGKSYIIFLKRVGIGNFAEVVPQSLMEATQANINTIRNKVEAQGYSVRPKPGVWMQHTGGWGAGVIAEFYVTVDGNFEWKQRLQTVKSAESQYEKRAGRLPEDVILSLIQQVAQAGPGPAFDDAGQVTFRWLDAKGEAQFKGYSAPDMLPAIELLETIETLTHQHSDDKKEGR